MWQIRAVPLTNEHSFSSTWEHKFRRFAKTTPTRGKTRYCSRWNCSGLHDTNSYITQKQNPSLIELTTKQVKWSRWITPSREPEGIRYHAQCSKERCIHNFNAVRRIFTRPGKLACPPELRASECLNFSGRSNQCWVVKIRMVNAGCQVYAWLEYGPLCANTSMCPESVGGDWYATLHARRGCTLCSQVVTEQHWQTHLSHPWLHVNYVCNRISMPQWSSQILPWK